MSEKRIVDCYDYVDHSQMLDFIFNITSNKMWADDVRWLKKFKYVPDKCVCCNNLVDTYSCICYECSKSKNEIEEVKKYINKNKKED